MAYILGFISADGNVRNYSNSEHKEKYRLSIGLKKSDYMILEKFKNELNYSGDIKFRKVKTKGKEYEICELFIYSKEIVNDLIKLGITPVKSLNIKFPGIPNEFVIDFIRGYFDGNGSIGVQHVKNKNSKNDIPQIRVRINSGSELILETMQKELELHGLKCKKVIRYKNGIYEIAYGTKESIKLYDLFYKNSNGLKLERKFNKFTEAINSRNEIVSKINKYVKIK